MHSVAKNRIGFSMLIGCLIFLSTAGHTLAGVTSIDPSMSTAEINRIMKDARGGDTLLFSEGTYKGPFLLKDIHGGINLPVVILGSGKHASVIDGETAPGMNLKQYGFHLIDCSWITIGNFDIRNCWTDLIRAEDVSYLSVTGCRLTGGKRALFATGRGSHHFLVEHCTWEQEERLWSHEGDFSWDEIHHGIHQHYNGSLFQGSGISGVFVLRDNRVENTFNAFRLSQINDGELDLLACTNGEVYRNTILNTSDNVLEPEVHAKNLHFYHNRMVNGHAFVSITEVAGGEIYIYGNTAVSLPDSEDGWTIFKISSRNTALTLPLWIFNNSWEVDFDIIGSPRNIWQNNHLRHFNNAIVATASDTFGIYNLGTDNRFDFDCSNLPWPALLADRGMEQHGLVADPGFMDPYGGDFRLKESSSCIDRGTTWNGMITRYEGSAPDIGAYDNGTLIEGPPFRYMQPDAEVPYREHPRITRYRFEGDTLKLWFSIPISEQELNRTGFRIRTGSHDGDWKIAGFTGKGYCLVLTGPVRETGKEWSLKEKSGALLQGELPDNPRLLLSRWPRGTNGMEMTKWASEMPVELF
jgi:hypothetical protein